MVMINMLATTAAGTLLAIGGGVGLVDAKPLQHHHYQHVRRHASSSSSSSSSAPSIMSSSTQASWSHPIGLPPSSDYQSLSMSMSAFEGQSSPNQIKVEKGHHGSSGNVTSTSGSGYTPTGKRSHHDHHHHQRRLEDTRAVNTDTSYPFSAIGKILWSNGVFCSGALVGPRHVATARHCAPSGAEGEGVSVRFAPSYDLGENADAGGGAAVTNVYTLSTPSEGNCGMEDDWAVLVLDAALGDAQGWLGSATPVPADRTDVAGFLTQGYPSDLDGGERPYLQGGVAVSGADSRWCDEFGPLITDAFAAGGQSGSPIWWEGEDGSMTSYGAMSSTTGDWTSFATGLDWVNTINQAREEFP